MSNQVGVPVWIILRDLIQKGARRMSWTVDVTGGADTIDAAFGSTKDQAAQNGMIEDEQRDIEEVRDMAVYFATQYENISVSAGGYWNMYSDKAPEFGEIHLRIGKVTKSE